MSQSGINIEVLQGDALECLRKLPNESIQCCVTSPPYWGLRDYGTAKWEGGRLDCDHIYNHGVQGSTGQRADRTFTAQAVYRSECAKCGARRIDMQIGLEDNPESYVSCIVKIFTEVRRVLRLDGTLWLNLGDAYSHGGHGARDPEKWPKQSRNDHHPVHGKTHTGLKPKDIVGIPWRVAFALQADGWYLRSDIIWHKPNPMPESVTDRPTKAHEYLFLLSKGPKYHYDADAIKEPVTPTQIGRKRADAVGGMSHAERGQHSPGGIYATNGKHAATDPQASGRRMVENVVRARAEGAEHDSPFGGTRNKCSVWTIPTQAYPEAHFATFPEDLVRPCILAGCGPGGTVLDPFAGSGTTLMVAKALGCNAIGIELNPKYVKLIHKRLAQDVLDFFDSPALPASAG